MGGDGPPGEVQGPPEAAHRVAACAPVLQRVLVYQVNLGAEHSRALLLDARQQRLQPGRGWILFLYDQPDLFVFIDQAGLLLLLLFFVI